MTFTVVQYSKPEVAKYYFYRTFAAKLLEVYFQSTSLSSAFINKNLLLNENLYDCSMYGNRMP